MFVTNDDLSIYATRGDTVFFTVEAEENGVDYEFQAGDVLRMKIFGKKEADNVVLEKCFPVTANTKQFVILLTEEDTKIGEVISKPTDYWYEVELNPFTNPQTIIGYDDNGAKVFKLFPEGADSEIPEVKPEDIPVVDTELDMTSRRPVENQAIARAVVNLEAALRTTESKVTEQTKTTAEDVAELDNDLAVERARIDNLVSGATADDAEIIDVRVGADGTTYASAGAAVRKQAEKIAELSKATHGYVERSLVWENGNLQFGVATNRIVTQMCVAKGDIVLYAPAGYRIALGVYEEADGNYTKVFDSNWQEGEYVSPYGAGSLYRAVLSKPDDSDIAPAAGDAVVIRERFNVDNLDLRVGNLETGAASVETRFVSTRNLFTGIAEWINADINGKGGGVLEPKVDNGEYAAVPTYMPIEAGEHVISWADIKNGNISMYLHFSDADKKYIEYQALYNVSSNGYRVFTAPANAAYFRVSVYYPGGENWEDNIPAELQVEAGNVPTNYVGAKVIRVDHIDTEALAKKLPTPDVSAKQFVSATIRSIAHRGEPINAPQCTEPAYIAAKKLGFNIAENDLYNSADGALVMWHDTTLARLGYDLRDINGYVMYTDGTNVYYHNAANGKLYTYADGYVESDVSVSTLTAMLGADYSVQSLPLNVLKRIDFGAYMGFAGTQILTFAEWVQLCKWLGLEIYIDKKIALTESIISEMVQTVSRLGMLKHTSWFVWDMVEVELIRSKVPNARIVWLDAPTESKIVSRKALLDGGAVVFNPHTLDLTETNTAIALEAGYEVECWNVDYANYGLDTEEAILAEIMRVCRLGVGGVTLDKYTVEDAIKAYI